MNNIEMWEHHGRIMLVDETEKLGYRGIERVWFIGSDHELGIHFLRFRADAVLFEQCAGRQFYEPMTIVDVSALYEHEGKPGAAVNVASCEDGRVDVWEPPQSEAAKWYLGDEL